jgi:hypothetical protein
LRTALPSGPGPRSPPRPFLLVRRDTRCG